MRLLSFLTTILLALSLWADGNVEINAKYQKDNKNYIYMVSKTHRYKIKKSELTKDGVKQILKNKESNLTLFIPEKSIVDKSPLKEK